MARGETSFETLARRYGLAVCCLLGPIVLSLGAFNLSVQTLVPVRADVIAFNYEAAAPELKAAAPQNEGAKTGAAPTTKAEFKQDLSIYLPIRHLAGSSSYAVASGFLYLAAIAAFAFSMTIIVERLGWRAAIAGFLIFSVIAVVVAFAVGKPRGRHLVVDSLLNKADDFPLLKQLANPERKTGDLITTFISINTVVSLIPVGMMMLALFALSIRPTDDALNLGALKKRLIAIRWALILGSAILVIGVLASKMLMEWPLSLVSTPQANALRPFAEAITLQIGATGTIALFAAFGPAVAAWILDVERYRGLAGGIGEKKPAKKKATHAKGASGTDGLSFAPLPALASIFAVLAPLLASPIVDAAKSILNAIPLK